MPAINHQSRARFGSGVRVASVTGTITRIAMIRRIAANDTGGTSRTPSFRNSQTVLQIRQTATHTSSVPTRVTATSRYEPISGWYAPKHHTDITVFSEVRGFGGCGGFVGFGRSVRFFGFGAFFTLIMCNETFHALIGNGATPFDRVTWTAYGGRPASGCVVGSLRTFSPDNQIDWSRAVVDSCSVRAVLGGAQTGPNPTDRAKRGSKRHDL